MEKQGLKETKEVVVALIELAAILADRFKDGVQLEDVVPLFEKLAKDPVVSKMMLDAYNDIEKCGAELADLDLAEGIELVMAVVPGIVRVTKAVAA